MAETATAAVQEQILDTVKTAQDATLKVFRGWTKTIASAPTAAEFYTPPKPESLYAFAEKMWTAQRDFFVSLMEVATEAGKAFPETVKRATTAATPKP
jgi:hypothetical protein